MKFCVSGDELRELEAAAIALKGGARLPALVTLAWHLRQRDSGQALARLEQAQRMLLAAQAAYPANAWLHARAALTRSEIDAFLSRVDGAEHWLAQARSMLPCAEDLALTGDALLVESMVAKAGGDYERECRSCAEAIECFESAGETQRAGIASAMFALLRATSHAQASPRSTANDGRPRKPDAAADTDAAEDAYWSAIDAQGLYRRDPMRAAELFLCSADQAFRMGLMRLAVISYMNAGSALQGLADFDGAAECFEFAEQTAKRSGSPILIASSRARIGCLLRDLGHLSASRDALESALASFGPAPPCANVANTYSELAHTLAALGLKQEALEAIGKAISSHRDGRDHGNLTLYLIAQARILATADAPAQAMAAVAKAEALVREHGLDVMRLNVNAALAEIHRLHHLPEPAGMTEPTAAIHHAELALQSGLEIEGWKVPASLYSLLADTWSEAGDLTHAYAYARKALEAKEQELALRPSLPQALLRLLLQTDAAEYRPLPQAKKPPSDDPLVAKLLTPREREVMGLLSKNLSNKDIALSLGISGETVKSHLRSIYAKLHAGSRRHALVQARNAGEVDE